ncbi:hypothetical protein ACOME3_000973 [Neoechinorhynchus agilis]
MRFSSLQHFRLFVASMAHKLIATKTEAGVTIIEGRHVQPKNVLKLEGPEEVCSWCKLERKGVVVQHTDVLILNQYIRKNGTVLPRSATGLCWRQYKKLMTIVKHAYKAGLFPRTVKPGWEKFNSFWTDYEILKRTRRYF